MHQVGHLEQEFTEERSKNERTSVIADLREELCQKEIEKKELELAIKELRKEAETLRAKHKEMEGLVAEKESSLVSSYKYKQKSKRLSDKVLNIMHTCHT